MEYEMYKNVIIIYIVYFVYNFKAEPCIPPVYICTMQIRSVFKTEACQSVMES